MIIFIAVEEIETPVLFIDVNIGNNKKPRIVLYNGDNPEDVATQFAKEHGKNIVPFQSFLGLDDIMKDKLVKILNYQLDKKKN